MTSLSSDLRTLLDSSVEQRNAAPGALRMIDGGAGLVKLRFESSSGRHGSARLDRWLAIIRLQPAAGCALWMLDARTARWSGGSPPGELHRGMTGLNSEETPILWFRAGSGPAAHFYSGTPGVFGAAGIVDGARVRVSVGWWRRLIRLRMTIDTDIWGLSGRPAMPDRRIWDPVPQLTITASGIPRPLRLMTVSRWL